MLPPHEINRQLVSAEHAAWLARRAQRRLGRRRPLHGLRVGVGLSLIRLGTALAGCEWVAQRRPRHSARPASASR